MDGIEKILEVLEKVFSEDGFSGDGFRIKATYPLELSLDINEDGDTELTFKNNLPSAKVFKKIRRREVGITVSFLGMIIGNKNGWIKLDNFPDIPFKLE